MSTRRSQLYCDETLPLSLCFEEPGPLRHPALLEWPTFSDQQLVYTGSLAELFCDLKVEKTDELESPGTPVPEDKSSKCVGTRNSPPALASAAHCTPTRRKKMFKRKRLSIQEPLKFTRVSGEPSFASVTPVM